MITKQMIHERSPAIRAKLRELGFKNNHKPRTPEKERAMLRAAIAFLRKFEWVRDEDGVLRKRLVEPPKEDSV